MKENYTQTLLYQEKQERSYKPHSWSPKNIRKKLANKETLLFHQVS